ncbi:hypothetical protein P4531_14220 [Geobacillus stearothermophilus]|uniref:hypothetical protein n=1 Tax=Geobacillus stearothermophilus TaxID=1422 RepID=UPI002E1F3A95|nr:hypothetical protein [Geobacillus stearothermophilus]MED3773280.1 hypothetical protein [Geobacillus stearothermophilus]
MISTQSHCGFYPFMRGFAKGRRFQKRGRRNGLASTKKTIQPDLDELRAYIAEMFQGLMELEYDRKKNGYVLKKDEEGWLTNKEILVVSKILLESRSLPKEEMDRILKNSFFNPIRKIDGLFRK